MIEIEKLLAANPAVDDWRVTSLHTDSYELFFVHRDLETVRSTDTVTTTVTVYVAHDGALGDSSFPLFEGTTEAEAAALIEKAVVRARMASNQPYTLPEASQAEEALETNFTAWDMPTLAAQIADAVFAADTYEDGSINATEVFVYRDTLTVRNSRGVDKRQIKYHAMIEAIPTWNAGGESVELYEAYRFSEFDAAKITAEIDRRMREVRDRREAKKPTTPMTVDVVLLPHEIGEFLSSLVEHMNDAAVYAKSNRYQIGDDLQADGTGDRLTVTMKGEIRGSVESARFDADGLALTDKTIIRDGKVCAHFGANRFAQYLGEEATGNLRCARLEPGSLTEAELAARPHLECVSLSGLQVDVYHDYIGGEIRMAYYFDGKERVPVTGISMSAKWSEVLKTLHLAEEITVSGGYEGPAKLLMPAVSVL